MKRKIICFSFFIFLLGLDAFAQTEYHPEINPINIDFGIVKVGGFRDTSITGVFYPGHINDAQKNAEISFFADTNTFSIDKNSIKLLYSNTIGLPIDTLHLRFHPTKEGYFSGSLIAKIGNNGAGSSFQGKAVTSRVSSNFFIWSPIICFPNPLTTKTTFSFTLPQEEFTTLKIYNSLGIEITTLINKRLPAGDQRSEFDASHLPSGVYYYRLQIGGHVQIKPMIVAH